MAVGDICVYCGREPARAEAVYDRTVGWVKRRGATGGGNAVVCRKTTGDIACGICIELLRSGHDPRMDATPGLFG